MNEKLHREVTKLKFLVLALIVINGLIMLTALNRPLHNGKFEEIEAEKISIMGTHGKPVMTLANKRLIPGVMLDGKSYPREFSDGRENYSGIIFFNEQGDEVGGLVYNGFPTSDTSFFAIEHLSFDQWKHNQVVAMQYLDNGRTKRAGLRVWDRPDGIKQKDIFDRLELRNKTLKNTPLYDSIVKEISMSRDQGDNGVERMFIGSLNEVAQIQLKDNKGRIRSKLYVDDKGNARLEFYDSLGKVLRYFPE